MSLLRAIVRICGVAVLLLAPCVAHLDEYPAVDWQSKTAAELGLDPVKVQEFRNYVNGHGVIARYGYLVRMSDDDPGWGSYDTRKEIASAVKPFYTHFLFHAIEQELECSGAPGVPITLDSPVWECESGLFDLNPTLGYKDRDIRWRDLANQISCYGVIENPATTFDYSDYNMALFFDTMFFHLYGSPGWNSMADMWTGVDDTYLAPLLGTPLDWQDDPTFMAFGTSSKQGRMSISARDFARFGLLYMRHGYWSGTPLIDSEHVTVATTSALPVGMPDTTGVAAEMLPAQRSIGGGSAITVHKNSYSFTWWMNNINYFGVPNLAPLPEDAVCADGHSREDVMCYIPSLQLVVSWSFSTNMKNDDTSGFQILMDALVDGPLPDQIAVRPGAPAWLGRQGAGPVFLAGTGGAEDFLYRGTLLADGTRDGDQDAIIQKLIQNGTNALQVQFVRTHGGGAGADTTQNPFIGGDPANGLDYDIIEQWEGWFTELDDAGIAVLATFYDDGARIWDTGDDVEAAEQVFLHAVVDRFAHHRNLSWVVAQEYQWAYTPQRVKNIAAEISAADEHEHVVAVHKRAPSDDVTPPFVGTPALEFGEFADDSNIDQYLLQLDAGSPAASHAAVVSAWQNMQAAVAPYNLMVSGIAGHGGGAAGRLTSWAVAMGGAYVGVEGMDFSAEDSPSAADLTDLAQLALFMESTGFDSMAPHDELAYQGTDYLLAQPGARYVAYATDLPPGGLLGVSDLAQGLYDLSWFDPATAQWVVWQDLAIAAGDVAWEKPATFGPEVALHVLRTGDINCAAFDVDGDGFSSPGGICAPPQEDCDDTRATVYPDAPELCDGIDNQCPGDAGHGQIDEDCGALTCVQLDLAAGLHDGTVFEPGSGSVRLDSGMSAGSYTASLVDAGLEVYWNSLLWTPAEPYGEPLDDGRSDHDLLLHLDETAGAALFADASGNGRDATCSNCPTAGLPGKFGTAAAFDGSGDLIALAGSFDPPSQGTITMWLRPAPDGGTRRVLGGHDAYEIVIHSDGTIANHLFAAGADVTYSTSILVADRWYHVAMTYDLGAGTSNSTVYLDGVLESVTDFADDDPGAITLSIGTRTGTTNYYEGRLDELTLWDRVLTEQEIQTLNRRGSSSLSASAAGCATPACTQEAPEAVPQNAPDNLSVTPSRYLQAVFDLATEDVGFSPELLEVTACYTPGLQSAPGYVPATIRVDRSLTDPDKLRISWSTSCAAAAEDYGIYQGSLGQFDTHSALDCSDDGADLEEEVPLPAQDSYYLVVPHAQGLEGSYGADSSAAQRPTGGTSCAAAQLLGGC